MARMKTQTGFTLIELMVAVGIVGIVAAIAIPAYTTYIKQAKRADAKATLLQAVQYLERYYNEQVPNTYANAVLPLGLQQSPSAGNALYIIILAATQTTYTLTAQRVAGQNQANDPCGDFVLDQFGQKTMINNTYTVNDCWGK